MLRIRRAAFVLAVALVTSLPLRARAGERTLACGSELVVLGASREEVLRKCGSPTSSRGARARSRSRGKRARASQGGETWTYDFGPGQFLRYLTFKRGRLERIEVGGYGS